MKKIKVLKYKHRRLNKMEANLDKVTINGKEYVATESIGAKAEKLNGLEYVIVRTYSAGVFAGYLKRREGKEVEIIKARRLWYWDGAASLSQLAIDGVSKPQNCKFPQEVESVVLTEAIEILPCSEKSKKSIGSVGVWKQ